ncbi:MAG TPA: HNH endonuclease signature motif containing protein [Propionibacteriaceae bacterium]|nr:HNH endonuclease signature motif containing protein [Propionibacteriaceae bacterium]
MTTTADRFLAKVQVTEECWLWTGALGTYGYGLFKSPDTPSPEGAHRWAYRHHKGPIPTDKEVDHTCHVRRCVNPEHLRLVTKKQNQENRSGPQANNGSGVRGVHKVPGRRGWKVIVVHNKRRHYGGYFTDVQVAASTARQLRNQLFTHNDVDRVRL